MIRIKVCGMTDPLNIREIVQAKPDFIGFIFFPQSPRYVGDKPDIKLFSSLPADIMSAGVFLNEDTNKILDISARYCLDVIQLHGNESPETCLQLKSAGLIVIKAFNIGAGFSFDALAKYKKACDFFLFDAKGKTAGGSGKKFDWGTLEEYLPDKPFFLSGGIGPGDAGMIKSMPDRGLFAIDINSRFEISPGIKDSILVKEFIDEIKYDQNEL